MLKVFLVEDEVVMRNGIKNNIPWKQEGFEFVGEASDGELAYPLIMREKPDILITDIKMPFMDGLELSSLVKKELPQIKILILSGYNEFDYAKTAIQIGVTDYLLKPISSQKLLEAVKRVADTIYKEQDQADLLARYEMEMEENLLQEKHNLWSALASNNLSTEELLDNGKRLGIDFAAKAYNVFLFKLMQGGNAYVCSTEMNKASEEIGAITAKWKDVLTFDRSPEGWAFLVKGETKTDVLKRMIKAQACLLELVSKYPTVEYFGGIGMTVETLSEIRLSYKEAAKAFASRFFTDANQIVSTESFVGAVQNKVHKAKVNVMHQKKSQEELVQRFFKNGTIEEVDSFLDELFMEIGEENMRSQIFRQYIIMDLFFSATDFLRSLGLSVDDLPEDCRNVMTIVEHSEAEEYMRGRIGKLFEETVKLRDGNSRKRYSELIEEATRFIDENYSMEEMSLNKVAAQVNISPSYFSTIFSTEMGKTFVEYLTSVRMDKAKELLMCTNKRTAEIGYEVGYKDSHYFSYIFKKVTGCTPKEFRNRGKDMES